MSGWIMCDAGIYPVWDEEEGEVTEALILEYDGRMHLAYYYPEGYGGFHSGKEPAYWGNAEESASWQLKDILCWRHKPALPPGVE